uniref:Uncharacterized protein n=1 Tax=Oryza barthii TaxID=65489 RepID=A0A0D3FKC1_9ORYZ
MGIPAAWRTSVHGAADGWARRATRKAPSEAMEWGRRGVGASQTGVGGAADGGGCGPCDEGVVDRGGGVEEWGRCGSR